MKFSTAFVYTLLVSGASAFAPAQPFAKKSNGTFKMVKELVNQQFATR